MFKEGIIEDSSSPWISPAIFVCKDFPICMDYHALVQEQFKECGHWVVQKTTNCVSALPIDQCYEQNNETIKSTGKLQGSQKIHQHLENG